MAGGEYSADHTRRVLENISESVRAGKINLNTGNPVTPENEAYSVPFVIEIYGERKIVGNAVVTGDEVACHVDESDGRLLGDLVSEKVITGFTIKPKLAEPDYPKLPLNFEPTKPFPDVIHEPQIEKPYELQEFPTARIRENLPPIEMLEEFDEEQRKRIIRIEEIWKESYPDGPDRM